MSCRRTTEVAKDYDADVWHAGVRAEYDLLNGPMTLTPFLGARLISGAFDGVASQTAVNVPIGLKFAGELSTARWTVVPAPEASYVRSTGDTEGQEIRFLPKDAFTGMLSLTAAKGVWSGEVVFSGTTGSNKFEARSVMTRIGLKF